MITALLVAKFSIAVGLVCPISGEAIRAGSKALDVNGVRYRFCCDSCTGSFQKDPTAAIKKSKDNKWLAGVSVFDPVSGKRLSPENAKGGFSDFEGVRFAFTSAQNKATFDADPKLYGTIPAKGCSICPVMGHELSGSYMAPSFVDFEDVRYFACCEQCVPRLRSNPKQFAASSASKVGAPKAYEVPAAWQKMTGPGL